MYESENEKMCVNDNQRGKVSLTRIHKVVDGQLFIIEPSGQAFLVRVGYMDNEKERELTPEEYMIIDGIEKC